MAGYVKPFPQSRPPTRGFFTAVDSLSVYNVQHLNERSKVVRSATLFSLDKRDCKM